MTDVSNLRQAAEQALEAWGNTVLEKHRDGLMQQSMESMREALEAPEQEPISGFNKPQMQCRTAAHTAAHTATASQEPVAWTTMPDSDDWDFISGSKNPNGKLNGKWYPLYTTPPRREFIGLTTEEIISVFECDHEGSFIAVARALESLIQEKNNG